MEGLARARVEAVVRYSDAGGAVTTRVLRADAPTFLVPADTETEAATDTETEAEAAAVAVAAADAGADADAAADAVISRASRGALALASDYLRAGVDHILRGWDHLLFVLGLLLLVKTIRPLLLTITAFTLAHSLTLALAATGAVRVPQAPAEALIALSLMLLAAELARPAGNTASLARQRPWAIAFGFGLLHGFGFAGALAELGLPDGEIPLALFAFNVGVECGQLAFVLAVIGLTVIARRLAAFVNARADAQRPRARANEMAGSAAEPARWSTRAPAYLIGALAALWFLERLTKLGS